MQGFTLNLRRPQFQDRRVREALTYAFDFESMNRTLFYGLYKRTDSYFEGGELASSGLPQGKELEILTEYKDKLPPELFTQEFKLPVYDTPQATRENLRKAYDLFKQAGWVNKDGKLVNEKTGEQFRMEFLGDDPTDERVTAPVHGQSAAPRHRRQPAHRRPQPVCQPHPEFRLRCRSQWCRRSPVRPAMSSAISGPAGLPICLVRATMPASRIRWWMRWSTA